MRTSTCTRTNIHDHLRTEQGQIGDVRTYVCMYVYIHIYM